MYMVYCIARSILLTNSVPAFLEYGLEGDNEGGDMGEGIKE
jgi:hypothetical protein